MSTYIFPGLWPFIERVARGRDIQFLGRAKELWHTRQVQDALGQIPRLDPESQRQLLEHVCRVRAALAVTLQGMDAAIVEVANEFELMTTSPEVHEPRHLALAHPHPHLADDEPHPGDGDKADARS